MALLDLPAMINYVIEVTNQTEIFYVGHSQGTVMGFAGFSVNQVLASHIKAFFALAPVAHAGHIKGLLRVLAVVAPEIEVCCVVASDFQTQRHAMLIYHENLC